MILCFCFALCLLLQARKLSLQQLHTMSDEEWRSLKLPVVRHYCILTLPFGHYLLWTIVRRFGQISFCTHNP